LANIFISFIGAGILGLPFAFKEAGLAEGVLIMAFVSFFSIKAMLLLVDCKYKVLALKKLQLGSSCDQTQQLLSSTDADAGHSFYDGIALKTDSASRIKQANGCIANGQSSQPVEELSYADVAHFAAGIYGQRLVEVSLTVSQIGFCCAYLIFISENLGSYVPYVPRYAWLLLLLPVLYLLTLYRELHRLAFFSMFAQLSNMLAFAVVLWFDLEHIYLAKQIHRKEFSWEGLPFFFAVAIYCFEGAGMILSLESSLATRLRPKFRQYFSWTLVVVTVLYILFGFCGYLSFGHKTNAIITLNLPRGSGVDFAALVKGCLCIALFFTYPVMMFPVSELLEKLFFNQRNSSSGYYLYENLLRLFLVALTGVIVVMVPSFANLMALIGASCCTLLAFVLPGYLHLRLHRSSLRRWEAALDYFLIIFGIFASVVSLVDTAQRLYASPTPRIAPHDVTSGPSHNDATPTTTAQFHGEYSSSTVLSRNPESVGGAVNSPLPAPASAAHVIHSHAPQRSPLDHPETLARRSGSVPPVGGLERTSLQFNISDELGDY
jgi:proton-coupled amino acid transporter